VGWGISLAVALVVMLYIALPALLRFGIPHELSRYGVESSIESARVDLIKDKVILGGFNVGPVGGPGIHWGEVVAQVDIAALLKGKIRVIDFQVKDARIDLSQMRAEEWQPPDRSADADGDPWDIDIRDVELRDVKFIGLSELFGRPVVVRSLKIGDFSRVKTLDRVALEIDGAIGEALLKLAGDLQLKNDLPEFNGRYQLRALDLDGLGALLGLQGPGAIAGHFDAAGSFEIRYETERRAMQAVLSGRASVADLKLASGVAAISEGGATWSGDVRLNWPGHGNAPRVEAKGDVTTKRLVAEHKGSGAPVELEGEELKWNGTLLYADALSIEGRLDGDAVRLRSRSAQTDDTWEMEGSRFALNSRHLWKGRESDNRAFSVTAKTARISVKRTGSSLSAALSKPSLSNLGVGASGFVFEHIFVDSARGEFLASAANAQPQRWQVIGLGARDVRTAEDGAVGLARLEVQQARMEGDSTALRLNDALAVAVTGGNSDPWRVDEITVGSLRTRHGTYETRGSEIQASGVSYADAGAIRADALRSARISQDKSGRQQWEVNGVVASGLSRSAELAEAERLSVASFIHGGEGEDVLEIDDVDTTGASLRTGRGAGAASIKLKALRHRSGQIAALELIDANIAELDVTLDGKTVMKSLDARNLLYTDADANLTTAESASLTTVSGEFARSVRVEVVRADRLSHDRPGGARLRAWKLELSRVAATIEGVVSAGAATVDFVETSSRRGNVFTAGDVTLEQSRWEPPLSLGAKALRVREGQFYRGSKRWVKVSDVEVGAIEANADGGFETEVARIGSARGRDDAVGSELRMGAVDLTAVGMTGEGRFHAGTGTLSDIELADASGDPDGATFSAARIVLENSAVDSDGLVDLGGVAIEKSVLVFGLSESEGLLLPKVPLFGSRDESSGGFAVTRLMTTGESRLVFFDRSTSPHYELAVSPLFVNVENLHTSDPARRADFSIEGGFDTFSGLKINGQVSVGNDGVEVTASGRITGYQLKGFNTYMAIYARESIRSGRSDMDFSVTMKDRQLAGKADVVFSRVTFEPVEAAFEADTAVPSRSLAEAFDLLKDPEDVVRIQVPISGSLDDPNFDLSEAVSRATTNALWSSVAIVFKPLVLLSPAVALASKFAQPAFNPVAFEPGEEMISGLGLEYLHALAQELQARPRVQLKICGRAVPTDLKVIELRSTLAARAGQAPDAGAPPSAGLADAQEQQMRLARSRALAVRHYLEATRLLAATALLDCQAEIETTAGSLPRVELLLYLDGRPAPALSIPGASERTN